ncbi:flagellar hook assembly protein FlgD [Microbacterium sp. ASV81]|uniref:Flagellar hook capping FlgD N-terminal domain-containing protein n=1 Tax=Microbacterium capsulatum TaxID=3041921 RepID=A0ABU0XDK4_9MICO|nr:flagellar hook capping FlgD N-terminal domain-containing protein [Microbacterium sp. ASV81]MDQ4213203.1 flagellar hook capping FlgD N-terminal domain-containing protein [Microbacterium sp. ASV81]
MPIEPVSVTSPVRAAGTTSTPAPRTQALDGQVFLKLLVTQLTNQDPSSPMDTNAMISQTTQLAMMEQLTSLASNGKEAFALNMRQAATALVGQQADYVDASGKTVSALVTKVSFDGPVPQVTIGGRTVPLDAITGITTRTTTDPTGTVAG